MVDDDALFPPVGPDLFGPLPPSNEASAGFRSGCFGARVIKSPFADRGARDGCVWVRETGIGVVGEAWVTEWPLEKIAIEALAIEPLA